MKTRHTILKSAWMFGMLGLALTGCRDNSKPGIEYAPQMVHSIPLEPYSQIQDSVSPFADGLNAQLPPEGTVARGSVMNYTLKQDSAGKAAAAHLVPPFPSSADVLAQGKVLYERYCGACHGKKGNAEGLVAEKKDEINPPKYTDAAVKVLNEGQIYHTIMVGKGVMGSHASQMTVDERWKVVHYVRTLQGNSTAGTDSASTAAPAAAPVADAGHAKPKGH